MTKEDAEHHATAWDEAMLSAALDQQKWHQTGDEYARIAQVILLAKHVSNGYRELAKNLSD